MGRIDNEAVSPRSSSDMFRNEILNTVLHDGIVATANRFDGESHPKMHRAEDLHCSQLNYTYHFMICGAGRSLSNLKNGVRLTA